jgi:hypothetical protein
LRFSRRWLWRMPSSWIRRRVYLAWTDVSEELITSIFRVEKFASCSHLLTLVSRSRIFLPWIWRRYISPKRRFTQDLHGATSQKMAFFSNKSHCHLMIRNLKIWTDIFQYTNNQSINQNMKVCRDVAYWLTPLYIYLGSNTDTNFCDFNRRQIPLRWGRLLPTQNIQCVPSAEQWTREAHDHFHRHEFWGSGTHQIPYPNDSWRSYPGVKGQEGNADSQLHTPSTLGLHWALHPFPPYAPMECAQTESQLCLVGLQTDMYKMGNLSSRVNGPNVKATTHLDRMQN